MSGQTREHIEHGTARLSAAGVTKAYGGTVVLEDADIEVFDGESVAIMGPSGSGKTTLLHALAGIIRPDSGRVVLRCDEGTVDIASLDNAARSALRRRSFGFVFQQGLLIPELTAIENVALPLLLGRVSRRNAEKTALEALDGLGLSAMAALRIGQLSGGQAQRVAIARAKVTGARVIFGDEPTGALDSTMAHDVLTSLLSATTGKGKSLVVVTHDETVAERCSRVVRLRDGHVLDAAAESSR
jgi:putative ABC transport system ATP-binding protein